MPSKNSNSNKQSPPASGSAGKDTSNSSSAAAPKSQYRVLKDAGYDNMNHFMQSYGLKSHDDDDLREGKAILEEFRKRDEAGQKK